MNYHLWWGEWFSFTKGRLCITYLVYDPVLKTVNSFFYVIIPQMFIRHLPLNVSKISSLEKWIDLEAAYFKAWTWYDFPINVDATHIYLWHLILKICRPLYHGFLSTYVKAQPEALVGSALLIEGTFVFLECFLPPRSPWREFFSQAWSNVLIILQRLQAKEDLPCGDMSFSFFFNYSH